MSCYRPQIRRSPIQKKAKVRRERSPWLPQRVREDAKGMLRLRQEAFTHSEGRCECWMTKSKVVHLCGNAACIESAHLETIPCTAADWCGENVTWAADDLHHIQSRAHGGSDVLSNLAFITQEHHEAIHGKPEWRKRA